MGVTEAEVGGRNAGVSSLETRMIWKAGRGAVNVGAGQLTRAGQEGLQNLPLPFQHLGSRFSEKRPALSSATPVLHVTIPLSPLAPAVSVFVVNGFHSVVRPSWILTQLSSPKQAKGGVLLDL